MDETSTRAATAGGLRGKTPVKIQTIDPPEANAFFEGVTFSASGGILAVAASGTGAVLLYRRGDDGLFEASPCLRLGGLEYPHDVAFASCGGTQVLAVVQRERGVALFQSGVGDTDFKLVGSIAGEKSGLAFSDGVTFLGADARDLAVLSFRPGSVSFFRLAAARPLRFRPRPRRVLRQRNISNPDGIAISRGGDYLAVANHGQHTVAVFKRRKHLFGLGDPDFGPEPVTVLDDPQFRHPHSVAFLPDSNDLIVTNAGANFFGIYPAVPTEAGLRWAPLPTVRVPLWEQERFERVNSANAMEGGPKGVAVHGDTIAVASPEIGVVIFAT
ncbi:MAG: beta-propeller fold lactonase family protein [Xanthobacteraceae bacterium]